MSIHSNRRIQYDKADFAIGIALMLVLGLALKLAHDSLTVYMNHLKKRAILKARSLVDAVQ